AGPGTPEAVPDSRVGGDRDTEAPASLPRRALRAGEPVFADIEAPEVIDHRALPNAVPSARLQSSVDTSRRAPTAGPKSRPKPYDSLRTNRGIDRDAPALVDNQRCRRECALGELPCSTAAHRTIWPTSETAVHTDRREI